MGMALRAQRKQITGLETALGDVFHCMASSEGVLQPKKCARAFEEACNRGRLDVAAALAVRGRLAGRLMKKDVRTRCLQNACEKTEFDIVRFMLEHKMVESADVRDVADELHVDEMELGDIFGESRDGDANASGPQSSGCSDHHAAPIPVPVDRELHSLPKEMLLAHDEEGKFVVLYENAWWPLTVCTKCAYAKPDVGGYVRNFWPQFATSHELPEGQSSFRCYRCTGPHYYGEF